MSYVRLGGVLLLDGLDEGEDGFFLLRSRSEAAVDFLRFGEEIGLELLGLWECLGGGCVWVVCVMR